MTKMGGVRAACSKNKVLFFQVEPENHKSVIPFQFKGRCARATFLKSLEIKWNVEFKTL